MWCAGLMEAGLVLFSNIVCLFLFIFSYFFFFHPTEVLGSWQLHREKPPTAHTLVLKIGW